jgi:hypothetical protein
MEAIYEDLDAFVHQRKWPVNAILINKLQEIHRAMRHALNLPEKSPLRRASDFGRAATSSAKKNEAEAAEEANEESKDESKFIVTVETPDNRRERNGNSDSDSDDSVPDLEKFIIRERPQPPKRNQTTSPILPEPQPALQTATVSTNDPQPLKSRQCVILADSAFRIVSGYLAAVVDKNSRTKTSFMCHSIGSATISNLAVAVHDGLPISTADEIIVHVGVNDVGVRIDRPTPATLKREYTRLVRQIRDKFPKAHVIMSHMFPIKTNSNEARRAVQIGNTAMEAAVAELRDPNVTTFNFGKNLLNGSLLRAHFYDNARHLNAEGGKHIAFQVREHYGLRVTTKPQQHFPRNERSRPHNPHSQSHCPPQPNVWIRNASQPQGKPDYFQHHNINNTRYNTSQFSYDAPPPRIDQQRPPEISRKEMLERTLNDFSAKLLQLFQNI